MEKNVTFSFKNAKERNVLNGKERSAQPWSYLDQPVKLMNMMSNANEMSVSGTTTMNNKII